MDVNRYFCLILHASILLVLYVSNNASISSFESRNASMAEQSVEKKTPIRMLSNVNQIEFDGLVYSLNGNSMGSLQVALVLGCISA